MALMVTKCAAWSSVGEKSTFSEFRFLPSQERSGLTNLYVFFCVCFRCLSPFVKPSSFSSGCGLHPLRGQSDPLLETLVHENHDKRSQNAALCIICVFFQQANFLFILKQNYCLIIFHLDHYALKNGHCKGVFRTSRHVCFWAREVCRGKLHHHQTQTHILRTGVPPSTTSPNRAGQSQGRNRSPTECWARRPSPGLHDPVRG